ncbi:hypothetical protein MSAN_00184400 [Mycena sanguinolenta]|uniref:Uncharacterized protein n=1 Tax=Mycena sanguinolenta TaxID=230812 RepID=A0A8H6ZJN7_9AGAR|nr:hypothetical protein MSAN_00184400 [Mycena sanguinolenta]
MVQYNSRGKTPNQGSLLDHLTRRPTLQALPPLPQLLLRYPLHPRTVHPQKNNRLSSPPTRTQTLPAQAAAVPPPNRRFSHVPGADKPLPSIDPQQTYPDPLGSPPPQSSLPASRRTSRSGASQALAATQNFNGRVIGVPVQQPQSSSNAGPRPDARSSNQTHPANTTSGDPSRYPNEHVRQNLRHRLSNASTASAIPGPSSPPRHTAPGQWGPDGRALPSAAPSAYQDPDASNSRSRAAGINPALAPPSPPPESDTDTSTNMGATISSLEVQSFHPANSFKINTGLLPAQQITPANPNVSPRAPKRSPSALVKGKPLIFAAMATVEPPAIDEKASFDPYASNAYPSPPPPADAVKMPPRLLAEANDDMFDLGFSKTVFQEWDQQHQRQRQSSQPQPPHERQTPKVQGNTSLPNLNAVNQPQTPRIINGGAAPLPPQSPPPPPVQLQTLPPQQPQTPQRVTKKTSKNQMKPPTPILTSPSSRPTLLPNDPPTPHTPPTPRLLTKSRPTTPQRKLSSAPLQQLSPSLAGGDWDAASRTSTLMLDDDPFAKVDPVRMLKPMASRDGLSASSTPPSAALDISPAPSPAPSYSQLEVTADPDPVTPRQETFNTGEVENAVNTTPPKKFQPPSPVTPEEYRTARTRRRGDFLEKAPPAVVRGIEVRETRIPGPFPLAACVTNAPLLSALLAYLSFYEWCVLSAVTKDIRMRLVGTPDLREAALERYLRTVGYARWAWGDEDPLELSLLDLHDYMRGVGIPTHEYSRVANTYVQSFNVPPAARDPEHLTAARNMTSSARAYTRVVLRLRAQAEREAADAAAAKAAGPPVPSKKRITSNGYASNRSSPSRASSRAPSPNSGYSQPHASAPATGGSGAAFRSPLFHIKRAPLLRVFVPSPDGEWLSDKSVLECEAELKRAGVLGLLRMGDVVWDIAVGDEGNVGRLVWDGSYLIDLDYKYSAVGDLPQYLPTLAFPPSYFHRVIRTGPASTNPVVHIDIAPWGQEIAANLQLLQDRVRTETPQGNIHNVVRWVHRSSFVIRPPPKRMSMSSSGRRPPSPARIPIPESAGLFVDPAWYGTIVVETEGTNEALADMQDRCPGAFPPRAGGIPKLTKEQKDAKKVFKILREKSRPGEIWIRTVGQKERLF